MKRKTHNILVLSLILVFVALCSTALAASVSRLWLSTQTDSLVVGQELTVDVRVEGAPVVYGADVRLAFDPALLEVVDADESQPGVQLEPGGFLDSGQAFVLQHQVDNQAGTIDYALALLNPAPAVQGNGLLARITFRARAGGTTTISIQEGAFGTQAGETIVAVLENVELRIAPEKDKAAPSTSEGAEQRDSSAARSATTIGKADPAAATGDGTTREAQEDSRSPLGPVVLGISGGLVLIGAIGVWLWVRRNWHQARGS